VKDRSEHTKENPIKTGLMLFLIALIYIIAIPFLIPGFLKGIYLRFKFRNAAITQGKYVIFVYSNSPHWKPYIEEHILPKIQDHTILLNWSDRSKWDRTSWIVQGFHRWGGHYEFNPLAIVYSRFIDIRVFRFYNAFIDLKHGNEIPLQKVESQFLDLVISLKNTKSQHTTT